MYILVKGLPNAPEDHFGPFGTKDRAERYAKAGIEGPWYITKLIVPYTVVKQIIWRNNDN